MKSDRNRMHALISAMAVFTALTLGCGSETPAAVDPPPAPKQVPEPTVEPIATPEPGEPAQVEVGENCDIEVLGEREVVSAALDTQDGKLTRVEVIDGRRLRIVCPENEEQRGALVIVELAPEDGVHSTANVVSWKVDLDPDPKTTRLEVTDAAPGVPELNEEDMELLQNEIMPDMVEWAGTDTGSEDGGSEDGEAGTDEPAKPAPAKVEVEFNSGRLKWAELRYENQASKRGKKVILDNKATRTLEPGTYAVTVRYPEDSQEWRDAGNLIVEAGPKKIQVTMKESPQLRADITSSQ
ncbi:MAG: hypothetical protein KC457_29765 [Myxococcales bacterium]|nr:hypothetical protein [Myxococcales bacterium]